MSTQEIKIIKASEFIDDAKLQTESDQVSTQLAEICTAITGLESQINDLKRQKTALEANLKDMDSLKDILKRLKDREAEGIK